MCCESKLQPHVKDGSIRKPKRSKQSIYVQCYLKMHAVDFICLYFLPKASSMLGFSFNCLTAWGSDLGCADGCGRQMGAEIAWTAADGVGATEWLEMGGEKKPLVMSDLGCADGCGRQMGAEIAWTAADGVGATEWLDMGEEKKPLVMSDLGCADGCGRQMGAENCADGCGRRGCKGVARNG